MGTLTDPVASGWCPPCTSLLLIPAGVAFIVAPVGASVRRSVVRESNGLLVQGRREALLPFRSAPRPARLVGEEVLLGNGVRADDDRNAILLSDERPEIVDVRAWGIPDQQAGRQVYDVDIVLLHFLRRILDVPPGTPGARREAHEFDLASFIFTESALAVPERPEALPAGASSISVADDDADANGI